jgi:hypothetical protein
MSRCGLGQTAPNPILSTLRNFPQIYEAKLAKAEDVRIDVKASVRDAAAIARESASQHGAS